MTKQYPRPLHYVRWCKMKERCFNKNHQQYKDYGGRGIDIYEPWINNFYLYQYHIIFLNNAGEDGMSIDRIDNNKGYYPGNLKWATNSEQALNSRIRYDNSSGYKNVSKYRNKWQSVVRVNGKRLHVGTFDTPEEAHQARLNYLI